MAVLAPKSRGGCVNGSGWDCFAMAAISTLGSWGIGPVAAGGSTRLNNNSIPRNLIDDVIPQPNYDPQARLPNMEVRMWYDPRARQINTMGPRTEEFARNIVAQRNALKVQARDMMVDRAAAALLDKTRPIQAFDYYVQKYSAQGYSGEDLWDQIILAGTRPNEDISKMYIPRR